MNLPQQEHKPAVIITGAGSGIGAATARLFSENGYPVILTGRRVQKLTEVAKTLKGTNLPIAADLTQAKDVQNLVKEALAKMDVGILINNAGQFERGAFSEASDEQWKNLYDVNVLGPVRLTRALLSHFQKRNGAVIVNIASTAGLRPVSGMLPYVTSKAALIGFSQALALETAASHIRVHCVCPGIVDTPIHGGGQVSEMAKLHPLGRAGKPEDVAHAVYSLCGPESDWMTGTVLTVDGGISLT